MRRRGFVPRSKPGAQQQSSSIENKYARVEAENKQDDDFGYCLYHAGADRIGWLLNMCETIAIDEETKMERSAVNFYFMGEDGDGFRVQLIVPSYFLIRVKDERRLEVEQYLLKRFEGVIASIEAKIIEDLDKPNHIAEKDTLFLKLCFSNSQHHATVRKFLMPIVSRNMSNQSVAEAFVDDSEFRSNSHNLSKMECLSAVIDIREYDVPYVQAVCISRGYRAGLWYKVAVREGTTILTNVPEMVEVPDLRIIAYDIETTKAHLKFPDPTTDMIIMISYMADGDGYLIVNRQIVSEDITDFEYTPKPEFPGSFTVFNEPDEKSLLDRFVTHIQEIRPHIFTTFNGDFFDFKFIDVRMQHFGWSLEKRTGIRLKDSGDEYEGRFVVHLDVFCWVRRDSYLPQGSQGLKAVTKAKLAYNPLEIDPEQMVTLAQTRPQLLASYSVSDAVATYYLYVKYVHLFVYSLCTIIPMGPADVLRKGSGTLCEQLLMVEASRANIVAPNKDRAKLLQFHDDHLLESQTYIGGHVECLKSGVFRKDLPETFHMDPVEIQNLIDTAEDAIRFATEVEWERPWDQVVNAESLLNDITSKLQVFLESPKISIEPLIYHLDVQAMYPNLILTNRLQPMAIVDDHICAACDYNVDSESCQRHMQWQWKGRFFPAKRSEVEHLHDTLRKSMHPASDGSLTVQFTGLPPGKQAELLSARVKEYSNKVYKKSFEERIEAKLATICQRENPFYVDTVRAFRDRRYFYKKKNKEWKDNLKQARTLAEKQKANSMVLLYDSMQLAHKCILNSFYGYVMRKGARWHSMEMAGVVTDTGANIIKMARELVDRIGIPLELDTDGIWCILPSGFPETLTLEAIDEEGKLHKFGFSYPCTILNRLVHQRFTNDQYLTWDDKSKRYIRSRENTIFFEVDGPYRAMVIPAAPEEGKTLKKRYAVFNDDGSLAELKGFEVKRRGELGLIKVFQGQVFPKFLAGTTLEECYDAVAAHANRWLDILDRKGVDISDSEVFELLSESKSMSQSLSAYENQRSTAITTAKHLAEFLGNNLLKDKLSCQFIISRSPQNAPVSDRAIPVAIFFAEPSEKQKYLRKWLGDSSLQDFDIRSILDWAYYITRLGSAIMKIITIPAALQGINNPVPRVQHPDWLRKRIANDRSSFKQASLKNFFTATNHSRDCDNTEDIENICPTQQISKQNDRNAPVSVPVRDEPQVISYELAPNMHQDFQGWLQFEKERWHSLHKRRRLTSTHENKSKKSFHRNDDSPFRLHIVQIVPHRRIPSSLLVWVYIPEKNELRNFTLHVPKKIYVNFYEEQPDQPELRAVRRTLPRFQKAHYLYEIGDASEETIRELSDSIDVESIYESKVPSIFRAIVQVGNMIQCRARDTIWRSGCSLSDLELLDGTQCSYNPGLSPGILHNIFVYGAGSEERAILSAFFPEKQVTRALVFIISQRGNPTDRPELQSFVGSLSQELGVIDSLPELVTEIKVVKSFDKAVQNLQSRITAFHKIHYHTSVVTLQLPSSLKRFVEDLSLLGSHSPMIPVIEVPSLNDNRFESLQWATAGCKTATARFLSHHRLMTDYLQCCRFSLIPIGNITLRTTSFMMDVFYARRLHEHDHILWCSSTDYPDIGSIDASQSDSLFDDTISNPEKINSGCYRGACVEMEVCNMAANALLSGESIRMIEETLMVAQESAAAAAVTAASTDYSHSHIRLRPKSGDCLASASAFAILTRLIATLFDEVRSSQNAVADALLSQVYKWISSPNSVLYEPNLYRLLHNLMQKVFVRLCNQFKSLGAQVILGTFNKLVLFTKRTDIRSALSFLKYASKSINEQEMFRNLSFRYEGLWLSLLYLDPANFTGIPYKDGDSSESQLHDNIDADADGIIAQGEWNIAEFLPEIPRSFFIELMTDFIVRPYIHCRNLYQRIEDQEGPIDLSKLHESIKVYVKEQAETHYLRLLLEKVHSIIRISHGAQVPDDDRQRASVFPSGLRGSHLTFTNPALEFIKMCTRVMALDETISNEVSCMKSAALQLIGVSPFSPDADFVNPCAAFRLADVPCSYCDSIRDLDITRSPLNPQGLLACPACSNALDHQLIESMLVEYVRRQSDMYQIQDLVCKRCGRVTSSSISTLCQCSGDLAPRITSSHWNSTLSIFEGIAKSFQFDQLLDYCFELAQ